MSYNIGLPIVTDGLVLNVDSNNKLGGNVSNTKNLTNPTEVGTFVNGLTVTNGEYVFDGVDDYINTNNNYTSGLSELTLDIWASGFDLAWSTVFDGNGEGGFSGLRILVRRENLGGIKFFLGNGSTLGSIEVPLINTTDMINYLCVYDGTKIEVFTNGVSVGTAPHTGSTPINANSDRIGGDGVADFTTVSAFKGSVSSLKIYNRALTAAEITQNYEAQKHRFE